MKKLFKKLSGTGDSDWRQELERQAAKEIEAKGSQRPAEANSSAWTPPTDAAPPVSGTTEASQAAPRRRLTAQQRVAARQHSG